MDLYEYQGKQYFARYGIPVSPGGVAETVDAAVAAAEAAGYPVVVKAQVQVGGRGKAGGIELAGDAAETRTHATDILGMDIKGHTVEIIWIERASDIAEEYYASFTLDRSAKKHLGMLSARGGVDIEAVAAEDLDAIAKVWVDALDAKVTLDGNSEFRHPDYEQYDATQVRDEREQAAHDKGLQYVGLDGYVGVIANGAGLAMSTVDIVNQVGGEPANFLDIGGGASAEVMTGALEVINNDPNVRAIFINIFGGITKGEEVANGIVAALGRVDIDQPIVIRLDGTNADLGRQILEPHLSDKLQMQPTMVDAARTAVALAGAAPK